LLPDFRKILALLKVSMLRIFVLLVRATCRCRGVAVWNAGIMILREENEVLGEKVIQFHFVHQKPYMD
jgi:hypothetical protein